MALMYLNRGEGSDHFALAHARVMAKEVDLTCYLSDENTLLSEFRALPCKVKSFNWPRGSRELLRAILTRRDPTGVSAEINRDAPDIVLDTFSSWWSVVVDRHLDRRIPIAEVVHDVTPHPGLIGTMSSVYEALFPTASDVAIALAAYSYEQLKRRFPRKAHIESRHGIFLPDDGIDTAAIAARRERMFFFGRIDAYKGIEHLVEAYGIARTSNPKIHLDIIGRGPIRPKVIERIEELGVGLVNRYVKDAEVKQAMAEHGVLILPYTSATQSGVAAIALGNGMPCIATRVGALPEQVQDGRNGIVVPPGDAPALAKAMLEVADDADLAKRMADESVRIGREEYSWEQISRKLLVDLSGYLNSRAKK